MKRAFLLGMAVGGGIMAGLLCWLVLSEGRGATHG